MIWQRAALALLVVVALVPIAPAQAGALKVDQRCEKSRYAYQAVPLQGPASQSFTPKAKAFTGADVLVDPMRTRTQELRLRLVARVVPEATSGLAARVLVLAERRAKVAMTAYKPLWFQLRPKAPVPYPSTPAVRYEFALEVSVVNGPPELAWIVCSGYPRGHAAFEYPAPGPVGDHLALSVPLFLEQDLAFAVYR